MVEGQLRQFLDPDFTGTFGMYQSSLGIFSQVQTLNSYAKKSGHSAEEPTWRGPERTQRQRGTQSSRHAHQEPRQLSEIVLDPPD